MSSSGDHYELDDKLWKAADKLRANLDAANYKHIVLGLIFLKYVSDAFEERQLELKVLFTTPFDGYIYYMSSADYGSDAEYQQAVWEDLEVLDYYQEKNVFWVPKETTALPNGSVIWSTQPPNEIKLRSISWLIDNALEAIESANIELNGILNRVSQYQLDNDKFIGLINSFSDTSFIQTEFNDKRLSMHSKDILGHVYDPAMGSGGFFVSSEKFIEEHAKEKHYNPADQKKHISVYGQESHPTTWKLAAMNTAIRGIDFNFGKKNADTSPQDIGKITGTFHAWQKSQGYADQPGFCFSADTEKDIAKHDFALTPGRYVGGAEQEADSEPFAEKMARLTGQLKTQFAESARLENEIKKNLLYLGYEI